MLGVLVSHVNMSCCRVVLVCPASEVRLGRWSLISLISNLLSCLPCRFLLISVLSIRVAVLFVILVSLVIQGSRLLSRFSSGLCLRFKVNDWAI